jgi:hypothetical protein
MKARLKCHQGAVPSIPHSEEAFSLGGQDAWARLFVAVNGAGPRLELSNGLSPRPRQRDDIREAKPAPIRRKGSRWGRIMPSRHQVSLWLHHQLRHF